MKRNIFFFTCLFSLSFTSMSVTNGKEITAPLGLKWGMTKSDFPENIKYISEIGYENGIDHFLVKNTDERIEGLEMYSVGIDKEYGLSVVDILFYINNDMGGNKATEKYNILKNVLVSKYGEQYSDEYIWRNHKKNSISFFDCINNEQCGKFSSFFEDDNGGSVTLMLTPTSSDKKVNVYLLYKSPVIKKINDDTKNNYNNEVMKKSESLADFF